MFEFRGPYKKIDDHIYRQSPVKSPDIKKRYSSNDKIKKGV